MLNSALLAILASSGQLNAGNDIKDDRQELADTYANRIKRNYSGDHIYVSGEVVKPKTFDLKKLKTLNLKDALRRCEGPTIDSGSTIIVVRDSKLYNIVTKKGDLATIMLDGGDLVFVPHKRFIGR